MRRTTADADSETRVPFRVLLSVDVTRTSVPTARLRSAGDATSPRAGRTVSPSAGVDAGVCAAAIDDASTVRVTDRAATRGRDRKLLVMS
jgi:hypothetical protein